MSIPEMMTTYIRLSTQLAETAIDRHYDPEAYETFPAQIEQQGLDRRAALDKLSQQLAPVLRAVGLPVYVTDPDDGALAVLALTEEGEVGIDYVESDRERLREYPNAIPAESVVG